MQSTQKLSRILLLLFCIHIGVCLMFIFFNSFLKGNKISRLYKVYVMPGPFFSEASISKTSHLLVSWKENGEWSKTTNHALLNFNKYLTTFNPTYLNQSRFERSLCQELVRKSRKRSKEALLKTKEFSNLKKYISKEIAPSNIDSVGISIILETSNKKDSILFQTKIKK